MKGFFLTILMILMWVSTFSLISPLKAEGILSESSIRDFDIAMEFEDSYKAHAAFDSVQLDSFILATMETDHFPGLSACIVKGGEIKWSRSYGYANLEDSVEVTDSTLFHIGSVGKTIAACAIMQLWQQGLFELDDDINEHLPFEVRNPWFPDSAITFRMLMTHSSSIQDCWSVMDSCVGDCPQRLRDFLEDYFVPGGANFDSSCNFMVQYGPGTRWEYCNMAAALVGYLVEAIADSFPIYCQDSIFAPLGMDEAAWFLADLDTSHIAMPYGFSGGQHFSYGHLGCAYYSAGQVRTSGHQLARFLITHMQHGEYNGTRILDSTTVELMNAIYFSDLYPNSSWVYDMGLLWYGMELNGRYLWGHSGRWWGALAAMFYCQKENTGVVVLTNYQSRSPYSGFTSILHELFEYANTYCPCGDGNGDTKITFADALYLKNYYFQTPPGSPAPIGEGDVNLDGRITFADALYIKNYYYQTPPGSPPPCEPPKAAPFRERRMEGWN
jgi:CubicO group peptidase (beta-lactamase class C family)